MVEFLQVAIEHNFLCNLTLRRQAKVINSRGNNYVDGSQLKRLPNVPCVDLHKVIGLLCIFFSQVFVSFRKYCDLIKAASSS